MENLPEKNLFSPYQVIGNIAIALLVSAALGEAPSSSKLPTQNMPQISQSCPEYPNPNKTQP